MTYRIQRDTIHLDHNNVWSGWCLNRCAWVFRTQPFDETEIDDRSAS